MQCPKCAGEMYDETKSKYWGDGKTQSGKDKPAWKCKKKGECDGAVWANKTGVTKLYEEALVKPRLAPEAGYIPGLDAGPDNHLPATVSGPSPDAALAARFGLKGGPNYKLYDECFVHALHLTKDAAGLGFKVDTAAIAATLFIQATR